jgi:hypothetical protein
MRTDSNIRIFQEQTGITPAGPELHEAYEQLSKAAFELIKIIPLEASGIRCGDGVWYGGDPFIDILHEVRNAAKRACELRHAELEAARAKEALRQKDQASWDAVIAQILKATRTR